MNSLKNKDNEYNKIDNFVIFLKSINKANSVSSVPLYLIILNTLPMIFLTKLEYIRITIMLLLNIFIRLLYPSSYYPATQSKPGIIYHPLTARIIAFIAEFGLYELWAIWINQDFWSNNCLWSIVLTGEIVSTVALILQSEILFNFEDIIWTYHSVYMTYLSLPNITPTIFFLVFSVYLIFFYLPRRIKLLILRQRCTNDSSSIFSINPILFLGNNKVKNEEITIEEASWIVPMLLSQPIITAFIYYNIN